MSACASELVQSCNHSQMVCHLSLDIPMLNKDHRVIFKSQHEEMTKDTNRLTPCSEQMLAEAMQI